MGAEVKIKGVNILKVAAFICSCTLTEKSTCLCQR